VHLFSTQVADISLGELRAGVCKSTGGTNIACVAAHMEANRVRRTLIVTDGWVGKPCGHYLHILIVRETGRRLSGIRDEPAGSGRGCRFHRAPDDRSLIMPARILPAEYVFPGHPDKLCDAIADALVAEAIRREPRALLGVEVAVHRNNAVVTGRIACHGAPDIDVDGIVRGIYRSAGYGRGWHPAPDEIKLDDQLCLGPLEEGEGEFRELSDDQAICIGYAINLPQTNYLPVEHWVARALARRLHRLRTEQPDLALGPDGKVIVFICQTTSGTDPLATRRIDPLE
jgi:hypothetical protein